MDDWRLDVDGTFPKFLEKNGVAIQVFLSYQSLNYDNAYRPLSIRALSFTRALRLEVEKGSTPI